MKKNTKISLSIATLVVLGYFLFRKKTKRFLRATGGYFSCSQFSPKGCKTLESCADLKIKEIKCEIINNRSKLEALQVEANKRKISLQRMLHITAMNIFTNNRKRTIKESLSHYGILPPDKAIQEYWDNFFQKAELVGIINQIKENAVLMNQLKTKAVASKITLEKQIRQEALKTYRRLVNEKAREDRKQKEELQKQTQQYQQSQGFGTPTSSGTQTQYISNYGNVPIYNLTPAQFQNIASKLVENPTLAYKNLKEGVYQVASMQPQSGGGGGGADTSANAGCGDWGTFNWSWCMMMRGFRSSLKNTGGY
jgi:hypothetical protein